MASVVLKSVGAAVGNALLPGFGGALFGGLGAALGASIDGQLGLGTTVTGPRLENLSVQDSRYGAGIPIIYGNARVAGNVIWSTNLIETKHTDTVGGKGGGTGVTSKTFTYSVHCAVGICAGPIANISKVWADTTVIYQNGVWNTGLFDSVSLYKGSTDQQPDSFMESILGAGNVPACRGLAYIVFDNLQLATFGNRLPNLTFEIAPTAVTQNPVCLGTTTAALSQRSQTVQNGGMPPLVLESNGGDAQRVLIGGGVPAGSTATFIAATFDVTGNTPVQLGSATSASFASSTTLADSAWALSPDKRFVACYIQTSYATSHNFALYDVDTQSFGPVLSLSMPSSSIYKRIVWLDAQHFVIDDVQGGVRGLRTFARAGTSVLDLGFTNLWGEGSGTSTQPCYGAQFTPYADGFIAYALITASKTLIARPIAWRTSKLSLGTTYTVASSLPFSGSGLHAQFLKTASGEWTLAWGSVTTFGLMSFEPSATFAVLTRPAQTFAPSFGLGTTNFPVFWGDRILIVQSGINNTTYSLSEVMLNSGSFSLTVDAASVSGLLNSYSSFAALKLNASKLLFAAIGGTTYTFKQLAIFERSTHGSIAAILSDILTRAGYEPTDFDVSTLSETLIQGYVAHDPMSARNAIEPLQIYAPFDLIETEGQLKAVRRGGSPVATVTASEWRAAKEADAQPPPLLTTRAEELDLPHEVDIEVVDPSRNFEINCQRARRQASSARKVQKISLPIVCNAEKAKQIAETRLFTAWAERELVKLTTSRRWLTLDPADVIDLGNGSNLRIASLTQSGGLIKIEGFYSSPASLTSDAIADSGKNIATESAEAVPTTLYLLDLPLLHSADDQPGLYVAATGVAGWKSASILRSSDGVSYNAVTSLSVPATAGIATTALPYGSPLYMDKANSVNVQLTQGTLSSCTELELMNGANATLLGGEIIQFKTATLIGPGLYTLSNLLRGRKGTEKASAAHAVGEDFILLQSATMTFIPDTLANRSKSFFFRALAPGQTLSDAQDYEFTYGLKTLCPLAPVNIKVTRENGNLTLTWNRRARLNAEWVDYVDVPLDEPQELYEVNILNDANVVRTFTVTTATVAYTAEQQTEDWGANVATTFTVTIHQISARYGKGDAVTAIV
jgi:hypothetical protein